MQLQTVFVSGFIATIVSGILHHYLFLSEGKPFVIFALLVFTIESCAATNVSVLWGICFFASEAIIFIVDAKAERTALIEPATVRLGLSCFERRVAFTIWGQLLYNYLLFLDPGSEIVKTSYTAYSVQQCLRVAEFFTTTMLLSILETETCMHAVTLMNKYMSKFDSTFNSTTIRRGVFLFIVAGNTTFSLLPRLNSIGITNFPLWLLRFLYRNGYYELLLCLCWIVLIIVFSVIAYYAAVVWRCPRTCNRKIFHFLVVLMFAPALHVCSQLLLLETSSNDTPYYAEKNALYSSDSYRILAFLVLALGVAVNVFILFEYLRLCLLRMQSPATTTEIGNTTTTSASNSAPTTLSSVVLLGQRMEQYMQLFLAESKCTTETAGTAETEVSVDIPAINQKSAKTVEMSHISLLLGCAMPVWLFAFVATSSHSSDLIFPINDELYLARSYIPHEAAKIARILLISIVPYVGLITLGVGDACAAIVGKLYGTHRWYCAQGENRNNTRTVEGSIACFLSMLCVTVAVVYSQYCSMHKILYNPYVLAGEGDTIVTAATGFVHFIESPSGCMLVCGILLPLLVTTATEAIATENDNILLPMCMITLLLSWCAIAF